MHPSTPRRPAATTVVVAAAAAVVLLTALDASRTGAPAVPDGVRTLAMLGATVLLVRAARRPGPERWVWRCFARGAATATAASAAALLLQAATASASAGLPVLLAGCLLACAFVYRGLIFWNRVRTTVGDPADWLNGVGAIAAMAAAVNLWTAHHHPAPVVLGGSEVPWLHVQLGILATSALVLLLGTVATIASLARLWRDPRPWVLLAGLAVALALQVTAATTGSPAVFDVGWVLLLLALAAVANHRAPRYVPVPASPHALTSGALVVGVLAVGVLAVLTRMPPEETGTAAAWAVLATAAVSVRVMHVVSDLARLAVHKQEARTDDLTGLPNRRALVRELAGLAEQRRAVALLALDLDGFKEVNDRYGHGVGDELLLALAPRFAEVVPDGGLLARCGGDEFAVVLPGRDEAAAFGVAHALEAVCREVGTRAPGPAGTGPGALVRVDVSIGVATTCTLTDAGELLRRADTAMYVAKAAGGGSTAFDPRIDERARRRAVLADELRAALSERGAEVPGRPFEVHYQPQVDTVTGDVTGVEALVRWRHPDLGLLGPASFLDLVEEVGGMPALTRTVLRTAAADLLAWRSGGTGDFRVSVNLSASCLAEPDLAHALLDALPAGTTPRDVVLEVTETTLMQDPAAALAVCQRLTAAGFGLSLDDYGTGYSTLSYLSDLPATELKIDRSFTARVVADERVRAVVAGTVALGHQLGLHVVAEGAEDEATRAALVALGCDAVQGYVDARPQPAAALAGWLRARRVTSPDARTVRS